MKEQRIRIVRAPKVKMFAPTYEVDGFEIEWDTRIQAWEMATPNPRIGGMYSFRIGRVVNGRIIITEMVDHQEASTDELSVAAGLALGKLGFQGVDLGEWEDSSAILKPAPDGDALEPEDSSDQGEASGGAHTDDQLCEVTVTVVEDPVEEYPRQSYIQRELSNQVMGLDLPFRSDAVGPLHNSAERRSQ
ncbi:hypothetical protein YH66_05145 [[Brevibacterium] flavum]|uniref:Uncharacterized protein n=1 Tax=[Brevibacterium] flavum TaxID=92706 RepID=A0A0F6SQX8_9CORY|nr:MULTISPECIES: hypothetical protein [Corynebacterium]AKF26984.1 hypothetical protein YH66_05145 [[Brevibacterium] flavum]ANE07806.1 hypothetical protein A3654_05135 [Corynebacterium glutamicum]AST20222.1 hypothetical protein CEY17_05200 [Corynebacterium glutamicum ATCC 14067]KEI22696.1 hypothetical protein KIQ_008975 [Corynebacterium glutamicum ATCC 14067]OKX93027.1 hypothetical protein AUP71_11205 [Corynebacterium glutamicum]